MMTGATRPDRTLRLLSQGGFAHLTLLGVLLSSLVVLQLLLTSGKSFSMRDSERLRFDTQNISTLFQIAYSQNKRCKSILPSPGLGAQLRFDGASRRLIPTHDQPIHFTYPTPSGGTGAMLLQAGTPFDGLEISTISVDSVDKPISSSDSYIAWILISTQRSSSKKDLRIPFYVISDSSGALKECYATRIAESGRTIEDEVCASMKGSTSRYDAQAKSCTGS